MDVLTLKTIKKVKSKFIICRGIQGSGKSTWSKQWAMEDPEHRIRFNNDDIRNMFGKYWVPNREHMVAAMKHQFFKEAMRSGYDIVVDNMNLNPKECAALENIVKVHNAYVNDDTIIKPDMLMHEYEVEYQDFKTPLEECIRRDKQRENPIGAGVITATYNRYKDFYGGE